jgi:UDP-N-acetylmuramyl pentapeptide phosphotransferase/UDP-N-acetylglucosamine-1-phosphate transferase
MGQDYDFAPELATRRSLVLFSETCAGRIGQRRMAGITITHLLLLGLVALVAMLMSLALIALLRPSLTRFALAHPNARSSHRKPTPQGGGIAVVVATFAVAWAAVALDPQILNNPILNSQILSDQSGEFLALTAAAAVLALVGMIDDMRSLPAAARLVAQCIAVAAVIMTLPHDLRLLPQVPWAVERTGLLLAGVWLVNLTNFMDGMDWMTVAELAPVTGVLVLLGLTGTIGALPALVAAALLGALLGFAPVNKPVARLFLGDVGSLPLGLLLGWLLLQLAGSGHVAAALILPLYYFADATITLLRRIAAREPVWQAHRTHFYQRATDNGFTVPQIVARVFLVNLVLAALALASIATRDGRVSLLMLAASAAVVAWLLAAFSRRRT